MSRITIVVPDNLVVVDGVAQTVDLSTLDFNGARVLQWYGDHGELEYHDGRPNFQFDRPDAMALEPFATALRWHSVGVDPG